MVLNATFNNILAISWSVLLVEETGVPGENHRPVASHWRTLSHNVVSSTPRLRKLELTLLVVIGTDCIGSCKSNYHMITCVLFWFFIFFPGFPTCQEETNIATRTSISKSWICLVWCGVIFCYAIGTLKQRRNLFMSSHVRWGPSWSWSYGSWIQKSLFLALVCRFVFLVDNQSHIVKWKKSLLKISTILFLKT
jgi:hypothetical protein